MARRVISQFLALALIFTLTAPAMAADSAIGTTVRLEETSGTVTIKDAAGIGKTTRDGMRLYNGYMIGTGASSSAFISLDDTKAVKLDSSSKAEIKKSGKKLEVSLSAGQLYFNITEPLKTDESLNIRTSTMVTGIRGSFGWVNTMQMGLMHGHVTLTCVNPETGETRTTEVYSGETVSYEMAAPQSVSADPTLLEIDFVKERITVDDVPAIVVEEIANDSALQLELIEDDGTNLDVTELIESLAEKRAEEKGAEEARLAKVEADIAEQESIIAAVVGDDALRNIVTVGMTDYVFTATDSSSDNSDGDSGDNYSEPSPTPSTPSTPTTTSGGTSISTADATRLNSLFENYDTVTLTSDGSNGVSSTLTIPSGKTLVIADGATYTNAGSLTNYGTITNNGILLNNGELNNYSTNTVNNYGSMVNSGTLNNGSAEAAGRIVNYDAGAIANNGTLNNTGSESVIANDGIFTGAITSNSGKVTGNPVLTTAGSCGTNLFWAYDSGILTIFGTGAMGDYDAAGESSIGESPWAEYGSTLTAVVLKRGVTSIGKGAFKDCANLIEAAIPDGVTLINDSAFWHCTNLAGVAIPSGVTEIGRVAFQGCTSLTSINIPSTVTTLGLGAFSFCSGLTNITIPSSVTSIDSYAFRLCTSMTSAIFEDGASVIGHEMFEECSALKTVTIPASMTTIDDPFGLCTGITDVYYGGTWAQWNTVNGQSSGTYGLLPGSTMIHCVDGSGYASASSSTGMIYIGDTSAATVNVDGTILRSVSAYTEDASEVDLLMPEDVYSGLTADQLYSYTLDSDGYAVSMGSLSGSMQTISDVQADSTTYSAYTVTVAGEAYTASWNTNIYFLDLTTHALYEPLYSSPLSATVGHSALVVPSSDDSTTLDAIYVYVTSGVFYGIEAGSTSGSVSGQMDGGAVSTFTDTTGASSLIGLCRVVYDSGSSTIIYRFADNSLQSGTLDDGYTAGGSTLTVTTGNYYTNPHIYDISGGNMMLYKISAAGVTEVESLPSLEAGQQVHVLKKSDSSMDAIAVYYNEA